MKYRRVLACLSSHVASLAVWDSMLHRWVFVVHISLSNYKMYIFSPHHTNMHLTLRLFNFLQF
jgi:hypothetical protein